MWRVTALTTLIWLSLAAWPAIAAGQSQEEVDAARADASAAQTALDRAATELVAAELTETQLEGSLLATIEAFEAAAAGLVSAGQENLAVIAEIESVSAEIAELRSSAADAASAAYRGAATGRAAIWLTDSFHTSIVAGEALDGHADAAVGLMGELDDRRVTLLELRSVLENSESALRERRDALDAADDRLTSELGIAAEIVERAIAQVAAADNAYQQALDRVELEERRLAALTGVEHWRTLVERYFPADRVSEALQVMHCESRGNPDATNAQSDAAGLFQFLETTWAFASANAGFVGASRYDPEANVASAAWLVHHSIAIDHPRGAWGHWSCQPEGSTVPPFDH